MADPIPTITDLGYAGCNLTTEEREAEIAAEVLTRQELIMAEQAAQAQAAADALIRQKAIEQAVVEPPSSNAAPAPGDSA